VAPELLKGEILEQYRSVVDAEEPEKKKEDPKEITGRTEGATCSFVDVCSEGCTGATTDETKKKKKYARVAGWFDPPVA